MRKLSRRVRKSKAHARRLGRQGAFTASILAIETLMNTMHFAKERLGADAGKYETARATAARCIDLIRNLGADA